MNLLETFKSYTNVNDATDLPQLYLDAAYAIVINYLGYDVAYQIYHKTFNGTGQPFLFLHAKPIRSIESIKILDGIEIPISLIQYTENEMIILKEGVFPNGIKNIVVKYSAGYDLEKDTTEIIDGDTANTEYEEEIDGGNADIVFEEEINGGTANGKNPLFEMSVTIPEMIYLTIMRIASLLLSESDGNIGITGKSFSDNGNRQFINYTNFDKYLLPLSKYKLIIL